MARIGRNVPCPCGSGAKFKYCHGRGSDIKAPDVVDLAALTQVTHELSVHDGNRGKFGNTRLPKSRLAANKRLVTVGNKVYEIEPHRYPCDFMNDILMDAVGREWGNAELSKPLEQRHSILQWFEALIQFQKAHPTGATPALMNGPVTAWYKLAYDLWILSHHSAIRDELIARLKENKTYQSARYEIVIAATFIRAGFDLVYEREDDNSRKHPEFVATHILTREAVAVEAKSRHRPGILGFQPERAANSEIVRPGLSGLIRSALQKRPEMPFIVCIDINAPPAGNSPEKHPLYLEATSELSSIEHEFRESGENFPAAFVALTNFPHHFGSPDQPDPPRESILTTYNSARYPFRANQTLQAIVHGIQTYGRIPTEWKDFE